jgi:hypothetical protein
MRRGIQIIFLLTAAASLGTGCNAAGEGTALFGEGKLHQRAEFVRIFNTKGRLADVVITTHDYTEPKDQNEWCSILHFFEDKYTKFEYSKNRKYQFGADKRRHLGTLMWPVDLDEDPENRSLFLLEVYSEFSLSGENLSYQGPKYAEELIEIRLTPFIVRKVKGMFVKEKAATREILRSVALLLAPSVGRDPADKTPVELAHEGFLKFAKAMALFQLPKEVDAAVELQKIISEIDLAEAAENLKKEDKPRFDFMNCDYLRLAAKRMINQIKKGETPAGGTGSQKGEKKAGQ